MTSAPAPGPGPEQEVPVVRDRRRIDPETGKVRTPDPSAEEAAEQAEQPGQAAAPVASDRETALAADLEERTEDLLRVKAEYDNYRRRVDRDRVVMAEQAVGAAAASLLPVLDDVDRAKAHEELTGGFKAVADGLERAVTAMGLVRVGEVGEAVDWNRHEAVTTVEAGDHPEGTVVQVLRTGWRVGDRVLRPAQVAVAG